MGSSGSIVYTPAQIEKNFEKLLTKTVYTPAQIEKKFEKLLTKLNNTPQRDTFCMQLEKKLKEKKLNYDCQLKCIEEYQELEEENKKKIEALNKPLIALGRSIVEDIKQLHKLLEDQEVDFLNPEFKEEKPNNGSAHDSNYFNVCEE